MHDLPEWMQQAVAELVLTEREAREIYNLCKASPDKEVVMPEHLHEAAERIYLWELQDGEPLIESSSRFLH